jgi:hypothetical protein
MAKRRVETLALVILGAVAALLYSSPAYARFRFQGDFSASGEYNDNINSASTKPISDRIWTASPSITLTEANARRNVSLNFGYSTRRYIKTTIQNRDTYTNGVSGRYNFSRRTFVDFYNTLSYTPRVVTQSTNFAPVFTDAGIVTQLITRTTPSKLYNDDVGASLNHQLNRRTTFSLQGKASIHRFSSKLFDNSDQTSVRADINYRASKRDTFDLSAAHSFYSFGNTISETRDNSVMLIWYREMSRVFRGQAQLTVIDDRTKTFVNNSTIGSRSEQLQAGGLYSIDRNTTLTVLAGASFAQRVGNTAGAQPTSGGNSPAPVYDVSLSRRFVHSTITARVRQTFNAGFSSGFDTSFEGLTYSYEVTPALLLEANLSRSASKSTGNAQGAQSINTDTVALYLRVSYKIDRRTFASISYSGVNQKSKGAGVGGNIKQNIVIISIDLLDLTHRNP